MARVVDVWVEAFVAGDALGHLGAALVRAACQPRAARLYGSSSAAPQVWTALWRSAALQHAELAVPARLLDVVVRYFQEHDEAILLELPVEQRELLEGQISRYRGAMGHEQQELDQRIERLIATAYSQLVVVNPNFPEQTPEKLSQTELDAQFCVVLRAGASTYAGLPLTAAPQSLVERFAAADLVRAAKNIAAFDIARLRVAELPWLGGHLAVLPHRENEIEVPFFVSDATIIPAARVNEWIDAAMADRFPPQPDENLPAYVRFLFATVVGRLGACRLADSLDEAIWLGDAAEAVQREFVQKLTPLALVGTSEDGRLELRGTVIFKNALFIISVLVAANWQLELASDDLLMDDLPIKFGPEIDLLVRR